MAHNLANYFEINRAKRAILHLVIPDRQRKKLLSEEIDNIKVKGGVRSQRFANVEKKSIEELNEIQRKKNLENFFNKYPGLEEEKIEDMKQFDRRAKGRLRFKNPDMSFCNFIISLCMFTLSVYTFYSHRDFN